MFRMTTCLVLLAGLLASGCGSLESSSTSNGDGDRMQYEESEPKNAFSIYQQKPPPQEIQSLQLYRKGNIQSAPVIHMDTREALVLEFDYLGTESKQFRASITHRNKNWEESPLPPDFYISGFNETYFSGGLKSFSQRPSYYHYRYEFPNSRIRFKASGNYLLSIYDYRSNELLFSLPFFVTENKGTLKTRINSVFVRREDLRAEDQPFSTYRYPDFVEFPQFDLSFKYVQNQFWGRSKNVKIYDTSSPQTVNFHLSREQAFLSNYEFNTVDLRDFTPDGVQILEIQDEIIPPKVILRRDTQAFETLPGFIPDARFGLPEDDRNASYANVRFTLETAENFSESAKIYLVGDFNNWTISELNRMQFDRNTGLWQGEAFIKEGQYAYKYVLWENGEIDDLSLDQGFLFRQQSYITLVYYRDPTRNYDRLLKVDIKDN